MNTNQHQNLNESVRQVVEGFLKSVKATKDGPDYNYKFDHKGKNEKGKSVQRKVQVDIANTASDKQQVDFSVDGRMTRRGGEGMARSLYKKVGKVIRAHDKLGRGTKGGYEFYTHHDTGMSGKGGLSGTRPKVTGKLLKRLAKRMGKKYSSAEMDSGKDQRVTSHKLSETSLAKKSQALGARQVSNFIYGTKHGKKQEAKTKKRIRKTLQNRGDMKPNIGKYIAQHAAAGAMRQWKKLPKYRKAQASGKTIRFGLSNPYPKKKDDDYDHKSVF